MTVRVTTTERVQIQHMQCNRLISTFVSHAACFFESARYVCFWSFHHLYRKIRSHLSRYLVGGVRPSASRRSFYPAGESSAVRFICHPIVSSRIWFQVIPTHQKAHDSWIERCLFLLAASFSRIFHMATETSSKRRRFLMGGKQHL